MEKNVKRWRLLLGNEVSQKFPQVSLDQDELAMDRALQALYNDEIALQNNSNSKQASLGQSYPNVAKWLSDIRSYFPDDIVSVIQADAIEKKGLKELIFEPETLKSVKPDMNMVTTLLALKNKIPKKSKEQARMIVQALVEQIMKSLEQDFKRAISGALNKKKRSNIASFKNMDYKTTIRKNLKNYDLKSKRIIPERFYFFESQKKSKEWNIILDIDQSASMCESIVYSSIMGSIFASLPSLESKIVAFDTNVVDLSETCGSDPLDILFGIQLGGGTDINKSVRFCKEFIHTPSKTLFVLISDLYEGGVEALLLKELKAMKEDGVTVLVLTALNDKGVSDFDERLARKIANLDIPCFACTPNKLPELIAKILKGDKIEVSSFKNT